MGRQSITRKAWQRATNALLWYPDNKAELADLRDELTTRNPEHSGGSSKPLHHDPTADTAIRVATNARYLCLEQETNAVEEAIKGLSPEQQEVIRRRFWWRRFSSGRRKPRQYDYLQDLGYSLDGLRWIVRKVILDVAAYLGER